MNLILQEMNGITHNLNDYRIKTIDFSVDAPSPRHQSEQIEGRHGLINLDTTLEPRYMRGSFFIKTTDSTEFQRLKNKIFSLFDARTEFYIIDDRESHKRWKVRTASGYRIEKTSSSGGFFEIEFISFLPFAESTFTTLNPDEHGQMLQVTQQNFNDPPVQYSFKTDTFFVWNDGEFIDPRESYLKIELYCEAIDLTLTNLTNGTEWKLNGDLFMYETIVIDGIRTLKDGVNVLRDTNKQLITLDKGWNEFKLTNKTSLSNYISFDFRFIYL